MALSAGTAYVDILPDMKRFGTDVKSGVSNVANEAGEEASSKIGGGFKKAAAMAGGAFAGLQVAGFFKDAIGAASDLSESVSKVTVVFGDWAIDIEQFAAGAAKNLGMSEQGALEAAGTFGNLFSAMGIGKGAMVDMSKGIIGLSADLASFNNASPEDVLAALKSGLVGETEPLRAFGVNLTAARIEAEAFALGLVKPVKNAAEVAKATDNVETATTKLAKATKEHGKNSEEAKDAQIALDLANQKLAKSMEGQKVELDAAQKAQASYSLIMKDTTLAQGDFERTSGGLANKQRILGAQLEDVKAKIGTALMPVMLGFVSLLSGALQPTIDGVIGTFKFFAEVFRDFETPIKIVGAILGAVLIPHFIALGVQATISAAKSVAAFVTTQAKAIAAAATHTFQIGLMVAGWVLMGVQSMIAAGKVALAWIIAMGPIALVVATVIGAVALIIVHWDTIKNAIETAFNWVKENWPLILAILTGPIGVAVLLIVKHWDTIKEAFTAVKDWIAEKIGDIVSFFTGLPGRLVTAAGDVFGFVKTKITEAKNWISDRLGEIVDYFVKLPGRFLAGASNIFDFVKDKMTDAKNWVSDRVGDIVTYFVELPGRFARGVGNIFGFIGDSFRGAINWVLKKWNDLSFSIGGQEVFGVKLPGVTIDTPDIPLLVPFLGEGGNIISGGSAIVGDRGAELLQLPRGARVSPLSTPSRSLDDGGSSGPLIGELNINGANLSASDVASELGWLMKTTGR